MTVLPKTVPNAEIFWTVVFLGALFWHFIVRIMCKNFYRSRCVEKELVIGGFFATSIATGIAFHNHVPLLPFDLSPVADIQALGWIVLFWTVSTFLVCARPIAKIFRLDFS